MLLPSRLLHLLLRLGSVCCCQPVGTGRIARVLRPCAKLVAGCSSCCPLLVPYSCMLLSNMLLQQTVPVALLRNHAMCWCLLLLLLLCLQAYSRLLASTCQILLCRCAAVRFVVGHWKHRTNGRLCVDPQWRTHTS